MAPIRPLWVPTGTGVCNVEVHIGMLEPGPTSSPRPNPEYRRTSAQVGSYA